MNEKLKRMIKKSPLMPALRAVNGRFIAPKRKAMFREEWLPGIFKKYADKPLDSRKVILVERRYGVMSDNLRLLYDDLCRDGSYRVHVHYLRESEVGNEAYEKRCALLAADCADASFIFLTDASAVISSLPLRPEQKVIQLWHACGAFKKFGWSTADKGFGMSLAEQERFSEYRNLSLVSVSSPAIIPNYEEAMHLQGQGIVKALGTSRTDVFFRPDFLEHARRHIEEVFPACKDKRIILYAPTFRGKTAEATTTDYETFNLRRLKEALGDEYVLVVKHHPLIPKQNLPKVPDDLVRSFVFDATNGYPIEELLSVSDICITDYSSVIFEYALFGRPMIFFAWDLADYGDFRGFYYPYEELAPGPVVSTTDEIIDYIRHLDKRFDPDVAEKFREKFMSACDGHATERIEREVFGRALDRHEADSAGTDAVGADTAEAMGFEPTHSVVQLRTGRGFGQTGERRTPLTAPACSPAVGGTAVNSTAVADNHAAGINGAAETVGRRHAPLVSVVVPVYNSAQYLKASMKGILSQTLTDIEVICVDDGSSDNSLEVLESIAQTDRRVRVYTQPNRSAGAARNEGLSHARGKYVAFWDADDLYEQNALELLYEKSERLNTDITVCAAKRLDNPTGTLYSFGAYLRKEMLPKEEVFSRETIPEYIFNFTTNVPWNKFYRRDFILENRLQYQPIRQANDVFFAMTALYCARRIAAVPDKLVTYRVENSASLTGKGSSTIHCTAEAFFAVKEYLEKSPDYLRSAELQRSFRNRAADALVYTLRRQSNMTAFREIYDFYRGGVLEELGLIPQSKGSHGNEADSHHGSSCPGYSDGGHLHSSDCSTLAVGYYYQKDTAESLRQIQALDADSYLLWLYRRTDGRYEMASSAQKQLAITESSTTFRAGKAVMYLPQKLKKILRKS